jgi:polyisoprenoid-binding protein YceI
MSRNTLTLVAALVFSWGLSPTTLPADEVLKVNAKSGTIEFVGFKDDGSHQGGFRDFSGTVKLGEDGLKSAAVLLEIKTGSLWSDHPKLTAHLQNEDFFHVDKFPKAVFRSTALREAKPDERKEAGNEKITHVLSGKLTLLGMTQEIELPVSLKLSQDALSVRGSYDLDRTRFGMNYGIGKIHNGVLVEFALKVPRNEKSPEKTVQ